MFEWNEYLKLVLDSRTVIDQLALSSGESSKRISPIVKASVLMLEDMILSQGIHNIIVFPEIAQLSKEFLLSKALNNIAIGKIHMSYDPNKFVKGQVLKFRDCAVEFESIETNIINGQKYTLIFVKFSDGMSYGIPIEYAPYFQISESKKLSTYEKFKKVFSIHEAKNAYENPILTESFLDTLENHKTHLNSSIFYVSSVSSTRDFLTTTSLNNKRISDLLFVAQVNGDGELSNISIGQLTGRPAIIVASDLYAVQNAINKGVTTPQSIIFDASQQGIIDRQLDAFDALNKLHFPIVCTTDTADSFELNQLISRNYNIWRWDSDSITEELLSNSDTIVQHRLSNCAQHSIEYRCIADEAISLAIKKLYGQKAYIEEQRPKIISAYEKLFSIALTMLRSAIPFDTVSKNGYLDALNNCISELEGEKRFTPPHLINELLASAKSLITVLKPDYKNGKFEEICNIILDNSYHSICILISEKLDKKRYEEYWGTLELPCEVSVRYPMDYQDNQDETFDLIIIVGWLGNKIMRKTLYSFSAGKYIVLTYPCEEKWQKVHTQTWQKVLDNSCNCDVIKKSFSKSDRQVSSKRFEHTRTTQPITPIVDEIDDIELVLRRSHFKQYRSDTKSSEVVEAYPVSFVGGYLAFYKSGHRILVATDIIANGGDKIESKYPDNLESGDFVIIRESEHDLICELADKILERSGKAGARALSGKWKESLRVDLLFTTFEELFHKLNLYGCKKDYATVRNWITNDDVIQPREKEDLLIIAKATGDEVLLEMLDQVYEAGRDVNRAHIQAGHILSKRLTQKIGEHIQKLGNIDAFNVWDPIIIQLEEIGQVMILKVIDVNTVISVDSGNTNRLLTD